MRKRSEEEMLELILKVAGEDEGIRAVWMNGSRADPHSPRDEWQDFDIVFAVRDILPYVEDRHFMERFGKIAVMQEPDLVDKWLGAENMDFSRHYAWLTLFEDGNRIDLSMVRAENAPAAVKEDCMTAVLLDKDGSLPTLPPADDRDYWVKRPTQEQFSACANEFWWCLNNVGKGFARGEIPYVKEMFDRFVRAMLDKLLVWQIGEAYGFRINPGKMGKRYQSLLPHDIYERYLLTYSDAAPEHIRKAVLTACDLFGDTARTLAGKLGLFYNRVEEKNMREYLRETMGE